MQTNQTIRLPKPVVQHLRQWGDAVLFAPIKQQPQFRKGETGTPEICDDATFLFRINGYDTIYDAPVTPKYLFGDVYGVRDFENDIEIAKSDLVQMRNIPVGDIIAGGIAVKPPRKSDSAGASNLEASRGKEEAHAENLRQCFRDDWNKRHKSTPYADDLWVQRVLLRSVSAE